MQTYPIPEAKAGLGSDDLDEAEPSLPSRCTAITMCDWSPVTAALDGQKMLFSDRQDLPTR